MSLESMIRALRQERMTIGLITMISLVVLVVFAAAIGGVAAAVAIDAARVKAASKLESTLRVCEDPNNLSFSNVRDRGFDSTIAALANECDVVMGAPAVEHVAGTRSYYRVSYVFVSRRHRGIDIRSFDDAALRMLQMRSESR